MSESFPPPTTLSPAFDKARGISRFLYVILSIGFWVSLVTTLVLTVAAPLTVRGNIGFGEVTAVAGQGLFYDLPTRIGAATAMLVAFIPPLIVLHHGRRIFGCFAKGEVFSANVIAHIKGTGLWLIIAACADFVARILFNLVMNLSHHPIAPKADPKILMLVFGAATMVAAYVMAEARRIADDNASIV